MPGREKGALRPGDKVRIETTVEVSAEHLRALDAEVIERVLDHDGEQALPTVGLRGMLKELGRSAVESIAGELEARGRQIIASDRREELGEIDRELDGEGGADTERGGCRAGRDGDCTWEEDDAGLSMRPKEDSIERTPRPGDKVAIRTTVEVSPEILRALETETHRDLPPRDALKRHGRGGAEGAVVQLANLGRQLLAADRRQDEGEDDG